MNVRSGAIGPSLPPVTHAVKIDNPLPTPNPPPVQPPVVVDLGIDFDGALSWNGSPMDRRTLQGDSLEVDLVPAQRHELRDPQPMPVGKKNECAIARAVAADLGGAMQELLDLLGGEKFPRAPGGVLFGNAQAESNAVLYMVYKADLADYIGRSSSPAPGEN